jgi:DNA-binding MarR family transcriptional regulator
MKNNGQFTAPKTLTPAMVLAALQATGRTEYGCDPGHVAYQLRNEGVLSPTKTRRDELNMKTLVSRRLERLVKDGLVVRKGYGDGGLRQHYLAVTPAMRAEMAAEAALEAQAFADFSEAQDLTTLLGGTVGRDYNGGATVVLTLAQAKALAARLGK